MKLGTKIFFGVTIFFSISFLMGGYLLLSFFHKSTVKREVENAVEQYQYNKFVLQAALITKGETVDVSRVATEMNHTTAIYRADKTPLYSGFPREDRQPEILKELEENQVKYQFEEIGGHTYIMIAGTVAERGILLYLITAVDIESVLIQQKQLVQRFGMLYGAATLIGIFLIFGLSSALTRRIKRLTRATREIAAGHYEKRIREDGKDELGQLARNFNRMASAVEEKVQELSEQAKQKEDFVANFAHELKTPLTSMIGYADRIYSKELDRSEQKSAAYYIWSEGMRLESLSHKLMDMTNLEKGNFVLQEIPADLLLQDLTAGAALVAAKRGVTIHCEAAPATVCVESDLMQSLFLNLVDNACKAGAGRIFVTGALFSDEEGELWYRIQLADDGSGIPEAELARIKEAFYMVDKSRSRKQHGAGIGLALAEKIAQMHGSTLEFESEVGVGTKVSLRLRAQSNAGESEFIEFENSAENGITEFGAERNAMEFEEDADA